MQPCPFQSPFNDDFSLTYVQHLFTFLFCEISKTLHRHITGFMNTTCGNSNIPFQCFVRPSNIPAPDAWKRQRVLYSVKIQMPSVNVCSFLTVTDKSHPQPIKNNQLNFRRDRKIAKSHYQLLVRLSVRMEQLDSHWKDFDEIWY